ncbi:hypothetical protein [Streptomyces sp. NBC_00648]|uniref:hypothetical protein n=1 Tax=Streptomyces sp. NBC_00648 TaxID=2975797 RepID=UPI0032496FDC
MSVVPPEARTTPTIWRSSSSARADVLSTKCATSRAPVSAVVICDAPACTLTRLT